VIQGREGEGGDCRKTLDCIKLRLVGATI